MNHHELVDVATTRLSARLPGDCPRGDTSLSGLPLSSGI